MRHFCRCLPFELSARRNRVGSPVTQCYSGFETDIRRIGREILATISGAHGVVSTKSFVSLHITHWSLTKLLQNVSSFGYNHTNLIRKMTLSVEHFHSTTHVKSVLMTQLQYAREYMKSIKEALKRCHPWSAFYFTSRKSSWYPPTENGSETLTLFCHQTLRLHP